MICDICEERNKRGREGNAWKEERMGWIDALGRIIGWIVGAGDISDVNLADVIGFSKKLVNSPENTISLGVMVSAIPPSFDNSSVVTYLVPWVVCQSGQSDQALYFPPSMIAMLTPELALE